MAWLLTTNRPYIHECILEQARVYGTSENFQLILVKSWLNSAVSTIKILLFSCGQLKKDNYIQNEAFMSNTPKLSWFIYSCWQIITAEVKSCVNILAVKRCKQYITLRSWYARSQIVCKYSGSLGVRTWVMSENEWHGMRTWQHEPSTFLKR